ncbi:unnamed protein product [Linum trigynum]|uniref:Uncharacterized protein n=1 Tax=Linum trigynum TaxID=586398 RepID=A0AAV2D6E3_9ROSI
MITEDAFTVIFLLQAYVGLTIMYLRLLLFLYDHPNARSYANTYIENWDYLVLLCAKDRAVGDGAEHYSEANASMADEDDMEDVGSASNFGNSSAHGSKSQGKKSIGEVSSESRKRAKKDSQVGDALYMVANSLSSYLQSKKKEEEPRYTGKEII